MTTKILKYFENVGADATGDLIFSGQTTIALKLNNSYSEYNRVHPPKNKTICEVSQNPFKKLKRQLNNTIFCDFILFMGASHGNTVNL